MAQQPIQPPTLPPMAYPPWHTQYNPPAASPPAQSSPAPPPFEPPAKRVKLSQPPQTNGQPQEKEQKESSNFDAFNDVALSAGVDLAREEELIRTDPRQSQSFKIPSTQSFSDRGVLSQGTEETLKDEVNNKHKAAARADAERRQEHMNDPFLQGHSVRKRMEKIVGQKEFSADPRTGLRIPMEGLFDLQRADEKVVQVQQSQPGPDGTKIMVAQQIKAPSKVAKDAPLSQIFAILSLGCYEHVKNLLEDAYGESRARRFNSDGIVPPEFSDLAFQDNLMPDSAMAQPSSTTSSPWEPPASTERQRSKVFQRSKCPTTMIMHSVAKRDRDLERQRLQRRADRKARRAKQAADAAAATTENGAAPADAAMPPPEMPKPISKKELQKQQKADYSEEAATRSANATAAMQIGGRQYSWMSGPKKKAASALSMALPAVSAKASSAAPSPAAAQTVSAGEKSKEVKLGAWREDGPGGRGVQMRDWVNVLERDGNEKKTLNAARLKLGHEDLPGEKDGQSQPPSQPQPQPQPQTQTQTQTQTQPQTQPQTRPQSQSQPQSSTTGQMAKVEKTETST